MTQRSGADGAPPSDRPAEPVWRGDAAAVACLSFDVDAESVVLAVDPANANRATLMSHQSYGPRVAVPRILELLGEYELRATFFVPGVTAKRYPWLIERLLSAGHEVGHHSHTHRWPEELGPDAERRDFERALEVLEGLGTKVSGHRTAGWSSTWNSQELVAEYGLRYDSSLMHDDSPYWLGCSMGDIVELPIHWSLDDFEQYGYVEGISEYLESPAKALEVWKAELDGMRRYGCLFVLTNHPFLSGRPGRLLALRELIEYALGQGDVEFASLEEVARRAAADPALPRLVHERPHFDDYEISAEDGDE